VGWPFTENGPRIHSIGAVRHSVAGQSILARLSLANPTVGTGTLGQRKKLPGSFPPASLLELLHSGTSPYYIALLFLFAHRTAVLFLHIQGCLRDSQRGSGVILVRTSGQPYPSSAASPWTAHHRPLLSTRYSTSVFIFADLDDLCSEPVCSCSAIALFLHLRRTSRGPLVYAPGSARLRASPYIRRPGEGAFDVWKHSTRNRAQCQDHIGSNPGPQGHLCM
jgi:hypothetical protein